MNGDSGIYLCRFLVQPMPHRSPLFVDKISLTLAVSDTGARGRISEAILHQDRVGGVAFRRTHRDGHYRHSKELVFDNDCKVLVQYSPSRRPPGQEGNAGPESDQVIQAIRDRRRIMRLEWNPSTLTAVPAYRSAFLEILRGWFGDSLAHEMWAARITRIDFAIDVRGLNINRIAVARNDTTVKSSLYLGRNGQTESNYLGSIKDSDLLYLLYDKRTERRGRVRGGPFERTRIEVRIGQGVSVPDLFALENPFAKLTIREFRELEICSGANGRYQWDWFIDSCKLRGLEGALNLISNARTRQMWRNRVVELESPDWWRPEEIWGGLRDAIEQIGVFERPSRIRRRLQ